MFFKFAEIPENETLNTYIAKQIGFPYQVLSKEVTYEHVELVKVPDPNDPTNFFEEEKKSEKTRTEYEYKVGNLDLNVALSNVINNQNTIVFLDGLDELHYQIRDVVFDELKALLSSLNNSKLIITSRYFEEVDTFKNISKSEILPLDKDKSINIISQWINDPDKFWAVLINQPYRELAQRPLFLFYLVTLYQINRGELPAQGVEVYEQIVLLVLREWDQQKEHKTERYSKLKQFNTYKKEEFIGHMAFNLTYEIGIKKIFKHKDLIKAYYSVKEKYPQLKNEEPKSVIKDIETDNALIITSFDNEYEFSHLTLQEYLCAKHILKIPFSRRIYDYLSKNPEPLALSVILSSEPSDWFAMLVLSNINEPQDSRKLTINNIYVFINRLIVEGAAFNKPTIEFGMAIFQLIFIAASSQNIIHVMSKFLLDEIALSSARMAKSKFKILKNKKASVSIERKVQIHSDLFLSFPEEGEVPLSLWDTYLR